MSLIDTSRLPADAAQASSTASGIARSLRRAGWVASGIVALALMAEAGLRWTLDNAFLSPPVFQRMPDATGYGLMPSVTANVWQMGRSLTVATDDQGHRHTVGAPAKAPATLHMVGDSQVFGWGLSDSETIASRLQQRLGANVRVVNHGVPGYGHAEYLEVVKRIPADEPVVVLHTEENDGADAYQIFRQNTAACSFIVSFTEQDGPLRCALMRSRLVESAFVWWNNVQHRYHMTPLGFSEHSQVAGAVLHHRITHSYDDERARRGVKLMFSVVPWKGRYSTPWLASYTPPPVADLAEMPTPFPDDVGMAGRFRAAAQGEALYIDGDTHLSPIGADLVAQALAKPLERLLPQPAH